MEDLLVCDRRPLSFRQSITFIENSQTVLSLAAFCE